MSHFSFKRSERLSDLLRKTLSELMIQEIQEPRVQGVTITAVEVTDDLEHAKVLFRLLQNPNNLNALIADVKIGLEKITPYLRRRLGKELRIKRIPFLHFDYDTSLEHHTQIDRLLRQVANDREPNA